MKFLRGLIYEGRFKALKLQFLEKRRLSNNLVPTNKILFNQIGLKATQLFKFSRRPGLRSSSIRLLHKTGKTRKKKQLGVQGSLVLETLATCSRIGTRAACIQKTAWHIHLLPLHQSAPSRSLNIYLYTERVFVVATNFQSNSLVNLEPLLLRSSDLSTLAIINTISHEPLCSTLCLSID